MCSPEIMANVDEAVTRRRVLGRLGMAGAASALGLAASATSGAAQQEAATPAAGPLASPTALGSFTQIQDLSHVVTPSFPMYPGAPQMQITLLRTIQGNGFYKNLLVLDEHTGTHMDAPAHFAPDGTSAESLPVERLVAPLAVIDVSSRAASDPDAQLMPDDITAWEGQHGPLPPGAFVAMYSGWEARLDDPASFINQDGAGVPHFPGFHPDAAALLVNERDIVAIGVDTVSLDFGASTDFKTHLTVLSAGKYGLENLAALASVPPSGATIIVGGPKHINASGGPTRAFAVY
jgi:kynurenine formamidase